MTTQDASSNDGPLPPPLGPVVPAPADPMAAPIEALPNAADAPYLPAAPPPPAAPAVEPVFDAKAMVEATTRKAESPAYGHLPRGTAESRAAADTLREQARKKRQRNKVVGWSVGVVFVGLVGAAGLLAYRAYEDDQDRLETDRISAQTDDASGAEGALTPLGEQQEVLDAIDDLSSTASPSAGGLLGAVDDARAAVDDLNSAERGATDDSSPVVVSEFPEYRTIAFEFRRYDSTSTTSEFTSYTYVYDRIDDHTDVTVDRSDAPGDVLLGFTDAWRFAIRYDGVVERVLRSVESMAPGPDSPWASLFGEDRVLPDGARSFAMPLDGSNLLSVDGDRTGHAYSFDAAAFRRADPEGYRSWRDFWNAPAADSDTLVDDSVRQVQSDPMDTEPLVGVDSLDLNAFEFEPGVGGTVVIYTLTADGYVDFALIIDPENDTRMFWLLANVTDDPSSLDLGEQGWVDAP